MSSVMCPCLNSILKQPFPRLRCCLPSPSVTVTPTILVVSVVVVSFSEDDVVPLFDRGPPSRVVDGL